MSALIFLCAILIGFVIYSLISSARRPKNFPPGEFFSCCTLENFSWNPKCR